MSNLKRAVFCGGVMAPASVLAATPEMTGNVYLDGVLSTVVYSLIGMIMAFIAMKVLDWATPGKLAHQIGEEKNVAIAIVVGLLMLGICIIIAAAIAG